MCIGCRERLPQEELARMQLDSSPGRQDKVVIVEHRVQRLDGRSVYLCPKVGCLDRVLKRGEIVFKGSKYDKIIVRLDPRQSERLRYAFQYAARRLRAALGVGPSE
jgi:predicted RNA-binding protein YlxR (DUF448 family)